MQQQELRRAFVIPGEIAGNSGELHPVLPYLQQINTILNCGQFVDLPTSSSLLFASRTSHEQVRIRMDKNAQHKDVVIIEQLDFPLDPHPTIMQITPSSPGYDLITVNVQKGDVRRMYSIPQALDGTQQSTSLQAGFDTTLALTTGTLLRYIQETDVSSAINQRRRQTASTLLQNIRLALGYEAGVNASVFPLVRDASDRERWVEFTSIDSPKEPIRLEAIDNRLTLTHPFFGQSDIGMVGQITFTLMSDRILFTAEDERISPLVGLLATQDLLYSLNSYRSQRRGITPRIMDNSAAMLTYIAIHPEAIEFA